jgi:hypothetical protein
MQSLELVLTTQEHNVIVGSLLGDGSMRCKRNALLEINHSRSQDWYVRWKFEMLQRLVSTGPKARMTNGGRVAFRFTTVSSPSLTPYYRQFYAQGRKVVPSFALSALSLAVWFMDDGSRSRNSAYLNTQQFGGDDQKRLMEALDSVGIESTLNRDKHYTRIRVRTSSIPRLRELIGAFLLPQMRYKLPK